MFYSGIWKIFCCCSYTIKNLTSWQDWELICMCFISGIIAITKWLQNVMKEIRFPKNQLKFQGLLVIQWVYVCRTWCRHRGGWSVLKLLCYQRNLIHTNQLACNLASTAGNANKCKFFCLFNPSHASHHFQWMLAGVTNWVWISLILEFT